MYIFSCEKHYYFHSFIDILTSNILVKKNKNICIKNNNFIISKYVKIKVFYYLYKYSVVQIFRSFFIKIYLFIKIFFIFFIIVSND